MKRILILLAIIVTVGCYAQPRISLLPFRTVVVSPNYPNIYPQYSKLQNVYSAIKDSASASTGKYFIINVVTSQSNITDWTSAWKDSIINRNPYMKLAVFGNAITDSITSVTTQEFNLVAGNLSLNSLIAGAGLEFVNHMINILYKAPLGVTSDTLVLNYAGNQFYVNGGALTLILDSGIVQSASGIKTFLDRNTLLFNANKQMYVKVGNLPSVLPLTTTNDTLAFIYATSQFRYSSIGKFETVVDSGLYAGTANSPITTKVLVDYNTIMFDANKSLTLNTDIAGDGLAMTANRINVVTNDFAVVQNDTVKIRTSMVITWTMDSLTANVLYCHPYDTCGVPCFARGKIKRFAVAYKTLNANDTVLIDNGQNATINAGDRVQLVWLNGSARFQVFKNGGALFNEAMYNWSTRQKWTVTLELWQEAL